MFCICEKLLGKAKVLNDKRMAGLKTKKHCLELYLGSSNDVTKTSTSQVIFNPCLSNSSFGKLTGSHKAWLDFGLQTPAFQINYLVIKQVKENLPS